MNQFINYAFSNILLARTERDAVINYISEHLYLSNTMCQQGRIQIKNWQKSLNHLFKVRKASSTSSFEHPILWKYPVGLIVNILSIFSKRAAVKNLVTASPHLFVKTPQGSFSVKAKCQSLTILLCINCLLLTSKLVRKTGSVLSWSHTRLAKSHRRKLRGSGGARVVSMYFSANSKRPVRYWAPSGGCGENGMGLKEEFTFYADILWVIK